MVELTQSWNNEKQMPKNGAQKRRKTTCGTCNTFPRKYEINKKQQTRNIKNETIQAMPENTREIAYITPSGKSEDCAKTSATRTTREQHLETTLEQLSFH